MMNMQTLKRGISGIAILALQLAGVLFEPNGQELVFPNVYAACNNVAASREFFGAEFFS